MRVGPWKTGFAALCRRKFDALGRVEVLGALKYDWRHPNLILRHMLRSSLWCGAREKQLAREIRLIFSTHDLMEEKEICEN